MQIKRQLRGIELKVKTDIGNLVSFNTKDYKHIENGYAVTVYKAQGDTIDKTFFLLSEKTSREATYVAMSRHKKTSKMYIDRQNFSDLIDWDRVNNFNENSDKIGEIESKTILCTSKKLNALHQKDTSLDYGSQQI